MEKKEVLQKYPNCKVECKRHSQKPEISYEIIERLYPNTRKLELFARRNRLGWDVWGNEVESDITLTTLPVSNENVNYDTGRET